MRSLCIILAVLFGLTSLAPAMAMPTMSQVSTAAKAGTAASLNCHSHKATQDLRPFGKAGKAAHTMPCCVANSCVACGAISPALAQLLLTVQVQDFDLAALPILYGRSIAPETGPPRRIR